jgi:regulatory protein
MGLSAAQLRARALALLSQREHSEQELGRKLHTALERAAVRAGEAQPDDAATQVQALLQALVAQGLLSNARYIDSRLRTRAPRLGTRRLAAELAQHGLQPEGDTWAEVQASEAARALALLQRRFGDELPPDLKEKARRLRFLLSRGFAPALAVKLVEGKLR